MTRTIAPSLVAAGFVLAALTIAPLLAAGLPTKDSDADLKQLVKQTRDDVRELRNDIRSLRELLEKGTPPHPAEESHPRVNYGSPRPILRDTTSGAGDAQIGRELVPIPRRPGISVERFSPRPFAPPAGKARASLVAGTQAGQLNEENGLLAPFIWVPPGKFRMGSPKEEKDRFVDEGPVEVTLSKGFWICSHEVTQFEWKSVMDSSPWRGRPKGVEGENYPATYVSWNDAMEFSRKLTERERSAGRLPSDWRYILPSEAQWEFACRAGTNTRFASGDAAWRLAEYGWFANPAGPRQPHPQQVERKQPNGLGLYDMHGNVSEWCRDFYASNLPGGTDPEVVNGGPARVRRGGSWNVFARKCRSASRGSRAPDIADDDVGFRLVLEPSVN